MATKAQVNIPKDKIKNFCEKWKIKEFSLFGSILRNDFHPDSDVDVLVKFKKDVRYTLFDLVHIEDELEEILGREVDLVTRRSVESSRNYIRKKAILSSAETFYAA